MPHAANTTALTRVSDTLHVSSSHASSLWLIILTLPGRSKIPTAASLVRPTRPAEQPQSFVSALREKYAPDEKSASEAAPAQIVFSGKVAQEMGFDKILRRLAQVKELKVVILDGMRIDTASSTIDGKIREICPSVTQLDLSRNLFTDLGPVVDVCAELPDLRTLRHKFVSPWM